MFTTNIDDKNTVHFSGRLDAAQAPKALEALDRLTGVVTVDLAGLEYISSAGLSVILVAFKRLTASGGSLRIVNTSKHVRHIFSLVRLDTVLNIE